MSLSSTPIKARQHAPLEKGLNKFLTPFDLFFKSQSSSGFLLLACAIVAMVLANSGLKDTYTAINHLPLRIGLGDSTIEHSLHHWVNDGLMVIFFFILGMEIKYEILAGELRDLRQSVLVIFMAVGGMLIPAAIYFYVAGGVASQGWGIPMATDTAFALGALAILGSRVPRSAAVLLSALAIVDDIGAVLVISIFYTANINFLDFVFAVATIGVMCLFNLMGVRRPIYYLVGGIILWWWVQESGIHPTTAGILAAMTVPARPYTNTQWFSRRMRELLTRFDQLDRPSQSILEEHRQHDVVEEVHRVAVQTTTPLQHWNTALDKPVVFLIVPLFAFLNAGVTLPSNLGAMNAPVMWATSLGLILGKGIGISLFAFLALRLGVARLPEGLQFAQIIGLAFLAGMGFTMSLFISALAFPDNAVLLAQAKLGIIGGSLVAGAVGFSILFQQATRS
ncbi:Na+/H+ antiporter NhaA [Marinibactrum halimedae]|uniref:Na(+)/H(+) antiporter NhaA n=1 Tax=Marinibactrum halimedae TaxID=1444977 RepID=A0AA37WKW5_9GAMM|nr:Na+/H+ antiporter NhaA [Marinibactrum halimedae]MCD9458180.1 Na+/H+ antiporter NhaA [Marinibactrum halimedae]GLS25114.1 Na(+)/H(+) antiporter NhaA [Marinibactrum halimedae]